MKQLIENYGLLIYPDGRVERVSFCTTFTEPDVTIVEFETEVSLFEYCNENDIVLPDEE